MADSSATPDQRSSVNESITEPASENGDEQRLERWVPTLATPIRKAGFWAAIVLPMLAVALLLNGLSTPLESLAFLGVVGCNLLALYVGHAHRR